jgi:hypothetical protein
MTLPARNVFALIIGLPGLAVTGALAAIGITWTASADETCCKEGDTTPPTELVAKVPKGGLHNPYKDIATVAEEGPQAVLAARLQRMSRRHWRWRHMPCLDARRLVLGQH